MCILFQLKTYEDYAEERFRKLDWGKYDAERVARVINNMPDFLVANSTVSLLVVAMEKDERLEQVQRLTPEVLKLITLDKRKIILRELVESERVRRTRSFSRLILHTFGWGLNELVVNNRYNEGFLKRFTHLLNITSEELKEEGYIRVIIEYGTGKIRKVDEFYFEDLVNPMVSVDVVREDGIFIAK